MGTSTGGERSFDLVDGLACADFHDQLFGALRGLGVNVAIHDQPFDLGDSPAFPDDRVHASYDGNAVRRFAQVLGDTERVLAEFAGGFNGKASPTQFLLAPSTSPTRATPAGRPPFPPPPTR